MNAFATRGDKQRAIENAIASFCTDAVEASEILAALTASLKDRYGEDALSDVLHEMGQLSEALDELERTTTGGVDEMTAYKDSIYAEEQA
jgi:hypothetical protein